jgi:hypothetical protein
MRLDDLSVRVQRARVDAAKRKATLVALPHRLVRERRPRLELRLGDLTHTCLAIGRQRTARFTQQLVGRLAPVPQSKVRLTQLHVDTVVYAAEQLLPVGAAAHRHPSERRAEHVVCQRSHRLVEFKVGARAAKRA